MKSLRYSTILSSCQNLLNTRQENKGKMRAKGKMLVVVCLHNIGSISKNVDLVTQIKKKKLVDTEYRGHQCRPSLV